MPAVWSMAPSVPWAGVVAIDRSSVSPLASVHVSGTAAAVPATTDTDEALQVGGNSRWRVVARVAPPT